MTQEQRIPIQLRDHLNDDRSKREVEVGSGIAGSGDNTYKQYIRNKRKIAHCCSVAYGVGAPMDQSAISFSGLLTDGQHLLRAGSDLMLRANNTAPIRYCAPEAKIKYTWGSPNQIMGATEDMCDVEIWKGESFEGLRSSQEWKSLSLNDKNFNQYAVVKAVPKSHRHIAMNRSSRLPHPCWMCVKNPSLSSAMRHRVQPVACRGSAPSDISTTACHRYAVPAYRH